MVKAQENTPELAREFVEAADYPGWGSDWRDMPILRTLASGLASGAFNDMDIDRVDEAHSIVLRLQEAGFCVVKLSELADLEGRVSQAPET